MGQQFWGCDLCIMYKNACVFLCEWDKNDGAGVPVKKGGSE